MKARIIPRMNIIEAATSKAQWLMIVALNDEIGLGEKRLGRVMDRYMKLLDEYQGLLRDEVADELLLRRVRTILPNVKELYLGDSRYQDTKPTTKKVIE